MLYEYSFQYMTSAIAEISRDANNDALELTDDSNTPIGGLNLEAAESETTLALPTDHLVTRLHHPQTDALLRDFARFGSQGVLRPDTLREEASLLPLQQVEGYASFFGYDPTEAVIEPRPDDGIGFRLSNVSSAERSDPYGAYNWELYFHAPRLIAQKLTEAGRFEQARTWLHGIFDPTAEAIWRFRPFAAPAEAGLDPNTPDASGEVAAWNASPFDPHTICRLRIRGYQRATFIQYLDNLIAWGDDLFRRDSTESINEAVILYFSALDILGKRPALVTRPRTATKRSFSSLFPEEPPPESPEDAARRETFENVVYGLADGENLPTDESITRNLWAFNTPPNPRLLGFWDTLEDRLFKIRNSLTIDGVYRVLPLYQPPIDPALLVRARQAGLSIDDVLGGLGTATLPPTRFRPTLALAMRLAQDVRSLGASLQGALERKDAEFLHTLRTRQEADLQVRIRDVRRLAIEEANEHRRSAHEALSMAQSRVTYYRGLLNAGELRLEKQQLEDLAVAKKLTAGSEVAATTASVLSGIGTINAGLAAGVEFGPAHIANAINGMATAARFGATMRDRDANLAAIKASYARREQEWRLQLTLATREVEQAEHGVAAAELRLRMAQQEADTEHERANNAEEVATFLESRYTRTELYSWMTTRLRALHRQVYQLAIDTARAAERSYRHEIGDDTASFIELTYFEPGRDGLLAGESLAVDLDRMEVAFLHAHRRGLQATRHVSLGDWNPVALEQFRQTGTAFFTTTHAMFDIDGPGEFNRRIQSVAVTISCNRGPHTSIPCKVSLLDSSIRLRPSGTDEYDATSPNPQFMVFSGVPQSIVTSSAVQDTGILSADDGRYLPFEGHGVAGTWKFELPTAVKSFDHNSITEVVLHVTYASRDGGSSYRSEVEQGLQDRVRAYESAPGAPGRFVRMDLRRQRPDAWHAWKRGEGALTWRWYDDDLPSAAASKSIRAWVVLVDGAEVTTVTLQDASSSQDPVSATPGAAPFISATTRYAQFDAATGSEVFPDSPDAVAGFTLQLAGTNAAAVRNVTVLAILG